MNIADEIGFIYVSCDQYSDLWRGYFELFRRYWPDCPFKIHLLTNTTDACVAGVEKLEIGDDISWSDNLLAALARVEYRYVFLLLDDFFLTEPVPSDWVMAKMRWAVDREASYLRFWPGDPRPRVRIDGDVGVIPRGALYRTSVRFPLWDKGVLGKILQRGESAWDFELAGSVRSDEFEGFYAIDTAPFKFANCVIKGRWDPQALAVVRRRGVQLDLARRRTLSAAERLGRLAGAVRSRLLLMVPYQSRRAVRSALLRFFGRKRPGSLKMERIQSASSQAPRVGK